MSKASALMMANKRGVMPLVGLKLLALLSQFASFYFLAIMAWQLIQQKQSFELTTLIYFAACVLLQLVLMTVFTFLQQRLNSQIKTELFTQWRARQQSGQTALIRQHSIIFWQQLERLHIPSIADYSTGFLVQKYLSALAPIITIAITCYLHWFVGLILIMTLPVVPLFMVLLGKGAASIHRQHFTALERLGSQFLDRISGLSLLQSFGLAKREQASLHSASETLNHNTMAVVRIAFLSNTLLDFYATLSVALVAVFIGFTLLGELSIGPSLTLFSGLLLLLIVPLTLNEVKQLGKLYHQKAKAEAASDILTPLLMLKTAEQSATNQVFDCANWQNWQLNGPTLFAANLHIKAGEHIWLQGVSGAGKTSLLEALAGFRDTVQNLAGQVALLAQRNQLNQGSIKANLTLGHTITDEKCWQVLTQVELDDWAAEMGGLEAVLAESSQISGGQMQRLALGRVLLADKPIVLLDEPTAHLTHEQHERIANLISQVLANKTVIWASHKQLASEQFDQIWLIEKGEIHTAQHKLDKPELHHG